jgi:hypothetical protein
MILQFFLRATQASNPNKKLAAVVMQKLPPVPDGIAPN